VLDQVGPDKPHRSACAAAIAAGIIKPVPTIRLVETFWGWLAIANDTDTANWRWVTAKS
jgi:hypothetical protein